MIAVPLVVTIVVATGCGINYNDGPSAAATLTLLGTYIGSIVPAVGNMLGAIVGSIGGFAAYFWSCRSTSQYDPDRCTGIVVIPAVLPVAIGWSQRGVPVGFRDTRDADAEPTGGSPPARPPHRALPGTVGDRCVPPLERRLRHRPRPPAECRDRPGRPVMPGPGGYFGAGVAIANLAGRTLADLITGRATDLTELPWVDHHSRAWEPEPVRWLGVHAATTAAHVADRLDRRNRLA
jgi:hypothetical protein